MYATSGDLSSRRLTPFFSVLLNVSNRTFDRAILSETEVVPNCYLLFFGVASHNLMKDVILLSALFVSIGGCIYAFIRQRQTQENMNIMLKELETLQQAEGNLIAVTEK